MERFQPFRRLFLCKNYRLFTSASQNPILAEAKEQALILGVDPNEAYNPAMLVESFQNSAVYAHDDLGFSWPASLLCIAASFRGLTLPLYIGSVRKGQRRAQAAHELAEIRALAKEAVLLRDKDLVDAVDREYKQRMSTYGISANPLQGFGYVVFAQIPWFVTTFLAIRGMSTQLDIFNSFICDSSFLWCESLALSDPYGILPLLSTSLIYASSGHGRMNAQDTTKPAIDPIYLKYALRGACFTFLPFAMHLSSGLFIFFIFNTVFNRLALLLVQAYGRKTFHSRDT